MMLQRLLAGNVRFGVSIVLAMLLVSFLAACSQPAAEPDAQSEETARLEENKELAVNFLTMILNEHKVAEAFDLYGDPGYIQHNPMAATGAQPAIDFFTPFFEQFPDAHIDIKRVIAEGDLVAIHNHSKTSLDDRGRAVVDIFRIENGRVVEHWDVVQDVPETSANENTMF